MRLIQTQKSENKVCITSKKTLKLQVDSVGRLTSKFSVNNSDLLQPF